MDKISSEYKVCESCGKEFQCGAVAQECWCFKVDLTPENLTMLRENYTNCLCQECLKNRTLENNKLQSANKIESELA